MFGQSLSHERHAAPLWRFSAILALDINVVTCLLTYTRVDNFKNDLRGAVVSKRGNMSKNLKSKVWAQTIGLSPFRILYKSFSQR